MATSDVCAPVTRHHKAKDSGRQHRVIQARAQGECVIFDGNGKSVTLDCDYDKAGRAEWGL